ncbi:L-xylulose 5-phosphate 3-epimerase [Bacteroidales bacterium Barb6]|nr:L-xylulose 5-phosphate 3-epimerase [Bacteroidales bacterium Barb6]
MKRRTFLKSAAGTVVGAALASLPASRLYAADIPRPLPGRTKIALNAFSFNEPLTAGEMTMDDMLEYAAETGFEGIDLTGYYFPGYPAVPTDDYIYHVKRKAFDLGIEICGTGVRNDFTSADPAARETAKKHIKEWVHVASKLGGQTLRIFAGNGRPEGEARRETIERMVEDIRECADYAGQYGIVLALQNHDDFLKTADEVEEILQAVNHEQVGLMLDIGSYRTVGDSFAEIKQTVKYAVTWQVKEEMTVDGKIVKTDLDKLKAIIDESGFRGYLPIETLGAGDPKQKIAYMFQEVKKRFGR